MNESAPLHARAAAGDSEDIARLREVVVDGLPFIAGSVEMVAAHICSRAVRGGGWVITPNVDILRRWRLDADFRRLVRDASMFTPDGWPIVLASRLQGTPLPGRVTGSDLFVDLYSRAARAGLRIALIGGNPGSAVLATTRLEASGRLPAGMSRTHCPPLGFEQQPQEMAAIDALLLDWRPRIVFVGLGSPKQERLIAHLRQIHPDAWYLGVGVSFSFIAGDVKRAPGWVQHLGMEWLHRITQEPGRLASRYLIYGLPFTAGLLLRAAWRRRSTSQ